MPDFHRPDGHAAPTNAERQARFRARRQARQPAVAMQQPRLPRRSRAKRRNDALAESVAVEAECTAWFDALPESLRDNTTAAALQEMIDLDLDTFAAIQPPLGYGRD
jgi:hypothetical protein